MSYQNRFEGFTPREERAVRRAVDLAPILFLGRLTVRRAALPADHLGNADLSPSGQYVVTLDLDKVSLPDDALAYLVLHELAHVANGHCELYQQLERAKSLDAGDKAAIKEACELQCEQDLEACGFDWAISAWLRCFPEDDRWSASWRSAVERRFESTYAKVEQQVNGGRVPDDWQRQVDEAQAELARLKRRLAAAERAEQAADQVPPELALLQRRVYHAR